MATIDVGGVSLHYTDEGAGEPVVLVHGFPLSGELWLPQRAALTARYRVIAPDLLGHGRSDPPHGDCSMDHYADAVVAVMDTLGIGQAILGGLSMGGYVVMAILRRRPDRVRGIMLMATKATPDTPAGKQGRDDMIALARSEGPAAVAEKMLPKMLTQRSRAENPQLVEFVRSMMARTSEDGIVSALVALRDRPDSTLTLGAYRGPALILAGAEDELIPASEAEAMHYSLASSRLELVPDAAHLLNLEQPDIVNRHVLTFLDRL